MCRSNKDGLCFTKALWTHPNFLLFQVRCYHYLTWHNHATLHWHAILLFATVILIISDASFLWTGKSLLESLNGQWRKLHTSRISQFLFLLEGVLQWMLWLLKCKRTHWIHFALERFFKSVDLWRNRNYGPRDLTLFSSDSELKCRWTYYLLQMLRKRVSISQTVRV